MKKKQVVRWILLCPSSVERRYYLAGWGMYPLLFKSKTAALRKKERGSVVARIIVDPEMAKGNF